MCVLLQSLLCRLAGMVLGDKAYVFATSIPETERDEDPGLEAAYKPLTSSANAVAFPATVSAGFGAAALRRCLESRVPPGT